MTMEKEITFHGFQSHVRAFLSRLKNDPIGAKVPEYLADLGLSKGRVIQDCIGYGLLTKKESIKDSTNSDEDKPKYYVKYTIISNGFEDKMHKYYNSMKSKGKLNECDGGMSAGDGVSTDGASSAAISNTNAPVTPMTKKPIRRVIMTESQVEYIKSVVGQKNGGDEVIDEATTIQNVGSMGNYDVAGIAIDKNDPTVKGRGARLTRWH